MTTSKPLLKVTDLRLDLRVGGETRTAIHGVDLQIDAGESVGLVGESGSGKSLTARSIMRLLPRGAQLSGEIRVGGVSVTALDAAGLRKLRASELALIFQDPRAHINAVHTIGDFLTEGLVRNRGLARKDADRKVVDLLREVGITDAERRLHQHPWQLSGGLLQRVMIASVLAAEPRLILADEPTTALDVTTQEEVMAILDEQRRERDLGMLFITHDLELASAVCDRIVVMYAGRVVEELPAEHLRDRSTHPYTIALLGARPRIDQHPGERLLTVPGRPISAFEAGDGCAFAPRCPLAVDRCFAERPQPRQVGPSVVACHFAEQALAEGEEGKAHA
ncbi:ABC transporter ATP-binding protein [Nonomuraea sp. NPDC049269]|uniref:ABC transporter ATP-binding protein n=1 Tax=Nonomuraea sp. NPDC049269 TaxID=3364349 RepID=UPI0037195CC4